MAPRPELTTVRDFQQPTRGDGGPPKDEGMEARVAKLEAILPTLATKVDVAELRLATKVDFAELRGDVTGLKGTLGASIAESKASVITWLSGSIFAAVAIILSTMFFLAGRMAPPVSPPAAQPIVIQMPAASTTPVPAQAPTTPTK